MSVADQSPSSTTGRRAELRRQRRRRRMRGTAAALAVLVVAALAFTAWLARSTPEPPPSVAEQVRTQRTLLLQVQGPGGEAGASALLAHDPAAGSASGVLVPPQVIVTVPGSGTAPLGRALRSGTGEGSRDALSDLLGVTIDGSWLIGRPAFLELVDALGGVEVDVDVQVVSGQSVLLSPGRQRLDGARAEQFLLHLAPGEQEAARLARQQQVLDGLLAALPGTEAEVVAVLRGLGDRSVSSLPLPELAEMLVGVVEAEEADALQYDVLPVIPIDTGGGAVTSARLDADAARALVDRFLAQSVPPGAREEGNRVLVLNGVGTPGLGEQVRARLVPAGFVFVGSRNAPQFGYPSTQVLVPESTPEAQQLGERVAAALGVPPTSVATTPLGTIADVVVIVGRDFAATGPSPAAG